MCHQGTLDLDGAVDSLAVGPVDGGVRRIELGDGAWIDVRRAWVQGHAGLLDRLAATVPWRHERRQMYDRVVDVPRLVAFYPNTTALPSPAITDACGRLDDHYGAELGEPFCTVGLCLYRDGRDSVAWHGDTLGRGSREDTMVAILSLGASRRLALRPVGGGPSRSIDMAGGDLVVMGGSCQRTWQHAVPKTVRSVGPRISVQFRPDGVR